MSNNKLNKELLCYVCSPVNYYYKMLPKNLAKRKCIEKASENMKKVYTLKESIFDKTFYPISAPLSYTPVFDDKNYEERNYALKAGISLLNKCDCIMYDVEDLIISEGIRNELIHSMGVLKIPVIQFFNQYYRILDLNSEDKEVVEFYNNFYNELIK